MHIFQSKLLALAISVTAIIILGPGCNKNTDFSNKIYFAQSVASKIVPVTIDGGKGIVRLSLVSALVAQENLNAEVILLDSNYLKSFNAENGTSYVPVPVTAIQLSAAALSIETGKAAADNILTVTVTDWPEYVDGKQYAIPVKLKATGSAQVLSGGDVTILSVGKVINTVAARSANGFSIDVKNVLGPALADKPVDNITIEGKFILTNTLIVPGNWRSDIFYGFGMQFCVFNSGGMDVRFPNSSFMFKEAPPIATTLNTWTHFAITYKGGTVTVYINGEQAGSSVSYPGLLTDGIAIASYTNGCTVSEFRIWNGVRSRQQLKTFACAVDPSTPGLLAYWRFNEGAGNIIKDVSGNGNDITASSAVTWITGVKCP